MINELDVLAKKYGTDKQLGNHGYVKYYDERFSSLRNQSLTILEIGVHTGASLRMWADYFPNAQIYGIDDGSSGDLCKIYENPRIHFREGSQINDFFLSNVVREAGQFDIILDDGSHYSSDILHTIRLLFPSNALKNGGTYVVEDLHCAYSPYTDEPLKSRFNSKNQTSVEFFKQLVDEINTKASPVESISFYPRMVFIKKA